MVSFWTSFLLAVLVLHNYYVLIIIIYLVREARLVQQGMNREVIRQNLILINIWVRFYGGYSA